MTNPLPQMNDGWGIRQNLLLQILEAWTLHISTPPQTAICTSLRLGCNTIPHIRQNKFHDTKCVASPMLCDGLILTWRTSGHFLSKSPYTWPDLLCIRLSSKQRKIGPCSFPHVHDLFWEEPSQTQRLLVAQLVEYLCKCHVLHNALHMPSLWIWQFCSVDK